MDEPDDLSARVPVLAGVAHPGRARRARNLRRVGIVVLVVVVAASCLGWLGPRDTTGRAEAAGAEVLVTYPQITRSGVDSAVEVEVRRDGAGAIRLEIPAAMVDRFGLETLVPAPSAEAVRGDTVVLTYEDVPQGDVTLRLMGRMPTRSPLGRFTHPVRVLAGSPEEIEVATRTWVLP